MSKDVYKRQVVGRVFDHLALRQHGIGVAQPGERAVEVEQRTVVVGLRVFGEDIAVTVRAPFGRIDQIATEGAAGYDAGQWFSTDTGAGAAERFKFVLDWTNADSPTVTVTEMCIRDSPQGRLCALHFLLFPAGIRPGRQSDPERAGRP